MNVTWLVPPNPERFGKGFPNVGQYRFFKVMPTRASIIYPYLTASGITQLHHAGFNVKFIDCPSEEKTWVDVTTELANSDVVIMEARTPIMTHIWECCSKIKNINSNAKTVLYGDHVMAFPKESLAKPDVDYILSSGDYDVGIVDLCQKIGKSQLQAQSVFEYPLKENLDELPWTDRELVNWRGYYEAWRHRDTFLWTMSGRGCWYNCTYCAWSGTLWHNRVRLRTPENVANEFSMLYEKYGECEILDDIDLFVTNWGGKFSQKLIEKGYSNKEILWAFQTHPNEIHDLDNLKLMRKAGLRTVKLGVESLNQKTLDKINKRSTVKQIEKSINLLKEARIMVHANLMVGFPWETKQDAENTIKIIKRLDPNQAQFSMMIPYPNTKLYEEAKQNGWLQVKEKDWDSFTAMKPMLKMEGLTPDEVVKLYQDHWSKFYFAPKYVLRHISKVRHWEGVLQLYRGFKSIYYGHMRAVKTC